MIKFAPERLLSRRIRKYNLSSDSPASPSTTYGSLLVAYTLLCWGTLPLVLKILITEIDPVTLAWYRFVGSAMLIAAVSCRAIVHGKVGALRKSSKLLLFTAALGLSANYVLYLKGLRFLTPGSAQIVLQVAPFFVLAGGVAFFRESFSKRQLLGVAVLAVGSLLFFNQRLEGFTSLTSDYLMGVGLIVLAAASWAIYILAQKKLVQSLGARTIMLFCYLTGSLILLIGVKHTQVLTLQPDMVGLLFLSIAITATSYVAFASALRHIQATKAGLAIANMPLITLVMTAIIAPFVDRIPEENLNLVAIVGAFLVVTGSMIGAAGPGMRKADPPGKSP